MTGTEVFSIFASLGLDTSEFDSNLSDAESAGSGFGTSFEGVVKKAKNALVTAGLVSTIESLATSLWNAASVTVSYADTVNKSATKIGITGEAYQKLDWIMQSSGTTMQANSKAFDTLRRNLDKFTKEGMKYDKKKNPLNKITQGIDELKAAGVQLSLSLEQDDIVGNFISIASALSMVESDVKRNSIAELFFGNQASNLANVYNMTPEELVEAFEQAEKYGGILTQDQLDSASAFDDSMQKLRTTWTGIKQDALILMVDTIKPVIDSLSEFLATLAPFIEQGLQTGDWSGLFGAISGFVDELQGDDSSIISAIGTAIGGVFDACKWVVQNWESVKTALEGFFLIWQASKITTLATAVGTLATKFGTLLANIIGFGGDDVARGLANMGEAAGGAGVGGGVAGAAGKAAGSTGSKIGSALLTVGKYATAATAFLGVMGWDLIRDHSGNYDDDGYAWDEINPNKKYISWWDTEEGKEHQAQVKAKLSEDAQAKIQSKIDDWKLMVAVTPYFADYAGVFNGTNMSGQPIAPTAMKATGLDYIPYDGFRMVAHRGEMLLNSVEAQAWRNGTMSASASSVDIGSAVSEALKNVSINMDGRNVGNIVTETVSENIQTAANRGRFGW